MKKLNLRLDDLLVESFETASAHVSRGTVQGLETGDPDLCLGAPTWYASCVGGPATACRGYDSCGNDQTYCGFTCNCVSAGCTDISRANSCQTGCGCTDTGGETGYTDYGCGENTA